MDKRNTILYVIDPQMRECSISHGWGTKATEAAVAKIYTIVPAFRRAGIPIIWIWSKIDETGTFQNPQALKPDSKPFERLTSCIKRLTSCIKTSLGGYIQTSVN
jgi:nicotinamidase-related amidase